MTPRERTIQLIEADIAGNNNLIAMAGHIKDPKERLLVLTELDKHVERTREILKSISNPKTQQQ